MREVGVDRAHAHTHILARCRFAYLSISTAFGWLSVHAVYRSMRDGGQTTRDRLPPGCGTEKPRGDASVPTKFAARTSGVLSAQQQADPGSGRWFGPKEIVAGSGGLPGKLWRWARTPVRDECSATVAAAGGRLRGPSVDVMWTTLSSVECVAARRTWGRVWVLSLSRRTGRSWYRGDISFFQMIYFRSRRFSKKPLVTRAPVGRVTLNTAATRVLYALATRPVRRPGRRRRIVRADKNVVVFLNKLSPFDRPTRVIGFFSLFFYQHGSWAKNRLDAYRSKNACAQTRGRSIVQYNGCEQIISVYWFVYRLQTRLDIFDLNN